MEYSASEYSSVDLNTNPKLLTTMPSVAAPLSTTAKQAIEAAGQKKNTKTEGSVDTHSTSNLIETSEGLLLPGRKKTLSHAQVRSEVFIFTNFNIDQYKRSYRKERCLQIRRYWKL